MRIKKVSQTSNLTGQVVDGYSTSKEDAYSANYINNLKKWKYLGSTTGSTAISLPNDYDELLIIVDTAPSFYINFTFNIPKLFLDSNNRQFVDGWYSNANSYGSVTIRANTSSLYLDNAIVNGTDNESVAVTKVYYR